MWEYLPLVGIALIFWLLLVRPTSRRQRELRTLQSSLTEGAEIMLTSGIYGTIREVGDDHVRVEIAEGVVIKVVRAAVGQVIAPEDESPVDDTPVEETPNDETIAAERRSEEN